jgi:hypothetical protein
MFIIYIYMYVCVRMHLTQKALYLQLKQDR